MPLLGVLLSATLTFPANLFSSARLAISTLTLSGRAICHAHHFALCGDSNGALSDSRIAGLAPLRHTHPRLVRRPDRRLCVIRVVLAIPIRNTQAQDRQGGATANV